MPLAGDKAGALPDKWVGVLNDRLKSAVGGQNDNKISDLASRTLEAAKVIAAAPEIEEPKAAKRMILGASEQDVIIPNGAQAMRLLRVNLLDRVEFTGPDGEEVHLEVPSVNYQLVPVPTD